MDAVHMCSCLSICLYICLRNTALTLACSSPFTHIFSPQHPCHIVYWSVLGRSLVGFPYLGKEREAMGYVSEKLSLSQGAANMQELLIQQRLDQLKNSWWKLPCLYMSPSLVCRWAFYKIWCMLNNNKISFFHSIQYIKSKDNKDWRSSAGRELLDTLVGLLKPPRRALGSAVPLLVIHPWKTHRCTQGALGNIVCHSKPLEVIYRPIHLGMTK